MFSSRRFRALAAAAALLAAAIAALAAAAARGGPPYVILVVEEFEEAAGPPVPAAEGGAFAYSPTAGELFLPPGAPRPRPGDRVLLWRPGAISGQALRWERPLPWGRPIGGEPPVSLVSVEDGGLVSLRWEEEDVRLFPGDEWGTRLGEPARPGTRVLRVRHEGLYDTLRPAGAPTG